MNDNRVSRTTMATQLEDALRADIIDGDLAPGQRLRSAELSKRYAVSATPLREALQRLAVQGLVELDPRLGATVAQVTLADLTDTYWLREILESVALERSIVQGDDRWVAEVTAAFEAFRATISAADSHTSTGGAAAWSHAHRSFHEALFSASSSPWLTRMLRMLYDHSERYRMLSRRAGSRDPLEEHAMIFKAAMARDIPVATGALHRHLKGTVDLLEPALVQLNSPSPDPQSAKAAQPVP
ncbi:MAG TPA: GntR family transcriptional regulator [Candidatus Limnocylindrales bacterium]|nr:GntR family transcriptional regulator [Candidatus Limnocylindrales bacterium]